MRDTNWLILNLAILTHPKKNKTTAVLYGIFAALGTGLLFGSAFVSAHIINSFGSMSAKAVGGWGACYILTEGFGVLFLGGALAVVPFLVLQGRGSTTAVNIIGNLVRFALCLFFLAVFVFSYKPLFRFDNKYSALSGDMIFVHDCLSDNSDDLVTVNNAKIYGYGKYDKSTVEKCEAAVRIRFVDEAGKSHYVLFSHDDYYAIFKTNAGENKEFNITYFKNSCVINSWAEVQISAEDWRTSHIQSLLDQNIEITLSVEDKKSGYGSIVFINRPEIEFYDVEHKHHLIPPEDDIYFYLKRDGEMYEVFSASSKTKFNDLTSIAQRREYGDYEITLVFGNDYIPISNTIRYTLDDGYHFSEDYESIPLKK